MSKHCGNKSNLAAQLPERVQNLRLCWDEWNRQNRDPLWLSGKYE